LLCFSSLVGRCGASGGCVGMVMAAEANAEANHVQGPPFYPSLFSRKINHRGNKGGKEINASPRKTKPPRIEKEKLVACG